MPKKKDEPQVMAEDKTVLILVPNVWGKGVKLRLHQVVTIDAPTADLLISNGQAKETKDDPTHNVVYEGRKGLTEAI